MSLSIRDENIIAYYARRQNYSSSSMLEFHLKLPHVFRFSIEDSVTKLLFDAVRDLSLMSPRAPLITVYIINEALQVIT